MAGGRTTPTTSPKHRASVESRDIVRSTQTFRDVYPDIKNVEDFKDKKYLDLLKPLRKSPDKIPSSSKKFLENMQKLENELKGAAIQQYSYDKAKLDAESNRQNSLLFTQLERKASDLMTALNVGAPKYDELFKAQTSAEFNANLNNAAIVHPRIAADPDFKARAQRVFQYISDYRSKNQSKLEQDVVDAYLNDIFGATESTFDEKIKKSSIIKESAIDPLLRSKIERGFQEYQAYRTTLEKRIRTLETVRKSKETIFSQPVEYAKSAERWISTRFQDFREKFAALDGKERTIAIATTLIGAAWFLNSNNEEVGKLRDILKKAGMVGIGYLAINTTTKAFTGKKASDWFNTYVEDRSGKRDLLKESFNASKHEAELLSNSLGYMGDYKFDYLAKQYMQQKERYDQHPIPENMKELPIGGVAENEMSKHDMYVALRLVDRKLKASNSSMADILRSIEEAKREAKNKGKQFKEPTYAMIVTGILLNQELAWKFGKDGKIEMVFARDVETKWNKNDKEQTRKWWPVTGHPYDWRGPAFKTEDHPKEKVNDEHLKRLTSSIMPSTKPLSNFITEKRFGRYTDDFMKLYEHRYSKNHKKAIHEWKNTQNNDVFFTSRFSLDCATFPDPNKAKVAALLNAKQQLFNEMKKRPDYKDIKDDLHKYLQPIHATYIAPPKSMNIFSKNQKFTSAQEKPVLDCVVFYRFVPKGSLESELRGKDEWPEGDMIEQLKEKAMKSTDRLTRSDFAILSNVKKGTHEFEWGRKKLKEQDKPYSGAYESFLNNFGLKKSQTDEIDKVLEFYSLKFLNSGISKAGLVRYLAAHKFTDKERREALKQTTGTLPTTNYKFDINNKVRLRTLAVVDAQHAISKFKNKLLMQNRTVANFGTLFVQACYGDLTALSTINSIDGMLYATLIKELKINANTGAIGNLNISTVDFDKKILIQYEQTLLNYLTDASKASAANKKIDTYHSK